MVWQENTNTRCGRKGVNIRFDKGLNLRKRGMIISTPNMKKDTIINHKNKGRRSASTPLAINIHSLTLTML